MSHAHQTLTLRSFIRQFPFRSCPMNTMLFLNRKLQLKNFIMPGLSNIRKHFRKTGRQHLVKQLKQK
jgi:hypothetical protein